jgi:hypothetical protein
MLFFGDDFVCAHVTTAAIAHKGSGDLGDDGGIKMADVRLKATIINNYNSMKLTGRFKYNH